MEIKEFSSDTYSILNDLYSSVDAYCHDPNIRELGDLDDEELLVCAKKHLKGVFWDYHQSLVSCRTLYKPGTNTRVTSRQIDNM